MARTAVPDLAIVLAFVRQGQGWTQTRLAHAAGTAPNVINDYEHGRKKLTRPRLEQLLRLMAVPPERIEATLSCLAGNRAASRAPAESGDHFAMTRRRIDTVALKAGRLGEDFARAVLQLLTVEGEILQGRQRAETLWRSLRSKGRTAAELRMLVEGARKYRHWALVERVAAESIEKAANHPREALELAELALFIAERVPGDALWRARLAGFAGTLVANGWRVCNDLHAMETALHRALALWEEGAPGDPGLLNPAVVPWIEAVCRSEQRRFREALKKIDQALELDSGELRGKILLSKSGIFRALGDPESSTVALSEADVLIDPKREPRLALYLKFNLLSDLCRMGRAEEAQRNLIEVRQLAEKIAEPLELCRIVWLRGLAAAGTGQAEDAEAAFQQARGHFEAHQLPYDYALVSLDLSLLLLEQNRLREVRTIAEEMLVIFKKLKIDREALLALRFFCEAAQREAATTDLARRVLRFLLRAKDAPGLQFEENEGAGAQ